MHEVLDGGRISIAACPSIALSYEAAVKYAKRDTIRSPIESSGNTLSSQHATQIEPKQPASTLHSAPEDAGKRLRTVSMASCLHLDP